MDWENTQNSQHKTEKKKRTKLKDWHYPASTLTINCYSIITISFSTVSSFVVRIGWQCSSEDLREPSTNSPNLLKSFFLPLSNLFSFLLYITLTTDLSLSWSLKTPSSISSNQLYSCTNSLQFSQGIKLG